MTIPKVANRLSRLLALVLSLSLVPHAGWAGIGSSFSSHPVQPIHSFTTEAIVSTLVVAPLAPLLRGFRIKSKINWDLSHDEIAGQLHRRAAVSLVSDASDQPELTKGQMTYGQAHYNVDEAIGRIQKALKPGVEAAIRRELNLKAYEALPEDIDQKVVFVGVGGSGVKNPVSFIGDSFARDFGVHFYPVQKIENAKQAGHSELVLNSPKFIQGRTVIWIGEIILGGKTFMENRQQMLTAGARAVEPFFLGSAPGLSRSDLNWIVASAAVPSPAPFARVVDSGRIPFTVWIDKAMQFSGDRYSAINAFKELFGNLTGQAKLNVFFNTLERFQARGLPEKDLLLWMAQSIAQDVTVQSLAPVTQRVAELITLRVQQNTGEAKKGIHRRLFADLAALLLAHENLLPLDSAQAIFEDIEDRFKLTPAEVLQRMITDLAAKKGAKPDMPAIEALVQKLNGYGLHDVDRELMGIYFQHRSPTLDRKLLKIREVLFERGWELAKQGLAMTDAALGHPDESPYEAIERLGKTFEQWHQWSLAYGEAFKKDHPNADYVNIHGDGRTDEKAFKGVKKTIVDEIEENTFKPLFEHVKTIKDLIQKNLIRPKEVKLKLSSKDPKKGSVGFTDRPARVAFFAAKGDPWQIGHIFMALAAIALHRMDKVVFMVDNSDPYRKPDLSSLTIREAITRFLMQMLMPFIEYTTISKEEPDLSDKDGERAMFRFIQLNRGLNIQWFYMAGSDHRHWNKKDKKGEKSQRLGDLRNASAVMEMPEEHDEDIYDVHYDTPKKIQYFKDIAKPDDYQGESIGIILNQRQGEMLEEGWQEKLSALAGLEILTTLQPMDTSSTRIREHQHWWTVPYHVFVIAQAIGFWAVEGASVVPESVLLHLPRSVAAAS